MENNKFKGGEALCLPGMEEYIAPILSQEKNHTTQRDIYNLRLLYGLKAADHFGLLVLKGFSPTSISLPLAFHEARAMWNKGKSLAGYFVHFYIADQLFDCIRRSPERYVEMLKSADFIIGPDFSTYRNYPFPILLKNTYDNMLLSAFFEREGIRVVANVIWSIPLFYDIIFSGQPCNGTICVSSKSLDVRDDAGLAFWIRGYREAICRLNPKCVIRIGKLISGEDDIYANPVRIEVVNPYVKCMRYGR